MESQSNRTTKQNRGDLMQKMNILRIVYALANLAIGFGVFVYFHPHYSLIARSNGGYILEMLSYTVSAISILCVFLKTSVEILKSLIILQFSLVISIFLFIAGFAGRTI